jgi:hypothetical protein
MCSFLTLCLPVCLPACSFTLCLLCHLHHSPGSCSDTRVQQVFGAAAGSPARVQLADGQTVTAAKGVVVAVEGPEAWRLLGGAMDVSQASI